MATNRAGHNGDPDSEQEPTKPVVPGRYARLKLSIGRHPSDLIRIVIAAGVVFACRLIAVAPGINPVEAAISSQIERLPVWTTRGWEVLIWAGWWPGIVAAAVLALYLGRVRLGASLALSGAAAWVLALVIQWTLAPRPIPHEVASTLLRGPGAGGFDFPDERTAVAAALAAVAAPYLRRPTRYGGWIIMVLVAMGNIFLGHNLPLGVFAGAVLGWGTGTLFHIVLGAPGRRTSETAVYLALTQAGIQDARIIEVHRRLLRPQEYVLSTPDGTRLLMKIVRRMNRRAGPMYKLRRALASVEVENDPGLSTPRHEVEHEAYITLLAERAGVGTLPVVLAGEIEHGPPFLIRRYLEGRPLSSLPPGEIDDALLDAIWADVIALGTAHIAHHDLRAQNILIDAQRRPRIAGFTFSRVGGPPGQRWQDAAEMLVSIAAVVGTDRAIASIQRSLPRDALADALPHLQRLALHRQLRNQLDAGNETLAILRETLAERIDAPVPSFRSPVRPATVAILLAGGLAVYLLLPQLSSMDEVLVLVARGNWLWLGVAVLTGFLAVLASAVSVLGSSTTRLPVRKTVAVQLAAAFTGRTTTAGIGFYGINWVFLERIGLRRAHAVAVIALNRIVMGLVSAVATILGIVVIGTAVPFNEGSIPTGWPIYAGAAAIVVAIVCVLASPFGRRRLLRPGIAKIREIGQELVPTLRRPLRAVQLIGGCSAYLLLSAAGLVATLAAFTPDFPLIAVIAVFMVASTLGQLVPTPGGIGAVEAAMIAGLTAIGATPADAVAAVLTSRVLTFWLPVLPGIVMFRILQHRGVV